MENLKQILITGASGFVGSHLIDMSINKGYEVWAAIRKSSNKQYLKDTRIHFITLDLNNPTTLSKQLQSFKNQYGTWDYIVHAAGVTKSKNKEGFFKTNTEGTKNFCKALIALEMVPARFVYMSSLSVLGATRDEKISDKELMHYAPFKSTDIPQPNTAYGESKWQAEKFLKTLSNFPYIILRPTGVYGPREKDYFLMAKSIKQHIDFAVGFKPQEITFIYVKDLVEATLLALENGSLHSSYLLSDGHTYSSRAFSDLLQQELDIKKVCHIKAPLWFLKVVCAISGAWAHLCNTTSTLNLDKYHILKQRNWQCNIETAKKELKYQPQYPLEKGVKESIEWYKKNDWL